MPEKNPAQELIQIALRKGKKKSRQAKKKANRMSSLKNEKILFLRETGKELGYRLVQIEQSFPSLDSMETFYLDLIEAVFGVKELKQNLGHLKAIRRVTKNIVWNQIGKIKNASFEPEIRKAEKEFMGRINSLEKDLEKTLTKIRKASKEFRKFPKIDFEAKTALLAGFPNTGKTTILKRLTGSNAKIAGYAFTTKDLMIGFFEKRFEKVQVIDTPGLLDKEEGKRNAVEKKAVSALKNLKGTVFFVVDPTGFCGFELEKQFSLFKEMKRKGFKVQAIINKQDLATEQELQKARELFGKNSFIAGKENQAELKKFVEGKLFP